MNILERFLAKVDAAGDCWLWTAYTDPEGYGTFRYEGKNRRAHRVAWMLLVGEIPEGLTLDHLCQVTPCVKPDHLWPRTTGDNTRAYGGVQRGLYCARGHMDWRIRPDGSRACRECARIREGAEPRGLFKSDDCIGNHTADWYVKPSGRDRYCRRCKKLRRRARGTPYAPGQD